MQILDTKNNNVRLGFCRVMLSDTLRAVAGKLAENAQAAERGEEGGSKDPADVEVKEWLQLDPPNNGALHVKTQMFTFV